MAFSKMKKTLMIKKISTQFSFIIFGVWGEHVNPGGDDSDGKLVLTSPKIPILCHYKGNNLAYNM